VALSVSAWHNMVISQQLLDILVCPQCKGPISMVEGGRTLLCEKCQLKYPVRNDIPVMLVEEAIDLRKESLKADEHRADINLPSAAFKIVEGPNVDMIVQLERGTCKAIGRALSDPNQTAMFSVDLALTLDESTKGLILQYITSQFKKSAKKSASGDVGSDIGTFRRTTDIVLDDTSISRLHAMIFYDEVGVGILDLVSKNGTYVNGDEVESRLLQKGDVIEVGETKMVFEG